jgi:hypothetical protein
LEAPARRRRGKLAGGGGLFAAALGIGALLMIGCGDDEGEETAASAGSAAQLAPVKDYLVDHAEDLRAEVTKLQQVADRYYELARSVDFDYRQLMRSEQAEVEKLMAEAKQAFVRANPAYEEMEGIVAGVPRLAQYDVDIDAGSDASDPESAVSFSLDVPGGETLKQPGNLFFLTETPLYGTNPELMAQGTPPDVDGDGRVEFGEGLPDAAIFKATLDEFDRQAQALLTDARAFEPTPSDAFTAITIMTPTMSEYFEAWKNSRFIAGEEATEQAFVAASRLQDIADILEGIVFTYGSVQPLVADQNPQQAQQTRRELEQLLGFVAQLRDREEAGTQFTAEQADAFGSEAQAQAEAIAGQVTQSAERLDIELQEA